MRQWLRAVLAVAACVLATSCYESDHRLIADDQLSTQIPDGEWREVGIFVGDSYAQMRTSDFDRFACERLLDGAICRTAEDGSTRTVSHWLSRQSNNRYLMIRDVPNIFTAAGAESTRSDSEVGFRDIGGGIYLVEAGPIGAPLWRYALAKPVALAAGRALLVYTLQCPEDSCEVNSIEPVLAAARQQAPAAFRTLDKLTVYEMAPAH